MSNCRFLFTPNNSKRAILLFFVCVLLLNLSCSAQEPYIVSNPKTEKEIKDLYQKINLKKEGLDYEPFKQAMVGYQKVQKSKAIISIIDFTKPSTLKRLYIIDLKNEKLLYHTLVAHGRGSGNNFARTFSNVSGSKSSSLGFFRTAETYYGKHGYSLRLEGLEKGINNAARSRAVVIHGADYVHKDFVNKHGRLGRSWGCPALPQSITKPIIDIIKAGSILFIYEKSHNTEYLKSSKIL